MGSVGFTTSVPVEVILAAGKRPVDLNNVFITAPRPQDLVEEAEAAGYPRTVCGWIKGLYAVAARIPDLEAVVAVMQGDCSNTQALLETLVMRGMHTVPFAYPFDRDAGLLALQMEKFMRLLGTDWAGVREVQRRLREVRRLVWEVDLLTWQEDLVTGQENHYYQVCSTDFNQDPTAFAAEVAGFLAAARKRRALPPAIRLAYLGVPPIVSDLYAYLESLGARVVYNEIQRQFSMPFDTEDLVEQYLRYTYPYGAFARLEDIRQELARRRVDGVIHYVQSFCFRQIEDMILRQHIDLPFLTLEADRPGPLDAHSRMRVETFISLLSSSARQPETR